VLGAHLGEHDEAFGPDVNLANVAPDGTLGLETFRLSLRADTYGAPAPDLVPVRGT
jgi:phosphosulfolactate synthase (CoM biosynthesis protein A)